MLYTTMKVLPCLEPVPLLLNCAAIKHHEFGHKCIYKKVKRAVQL